MYIYRKEKKCHYNVGDTVRCNIKERYYSHVGFKNTTNMINGEIIHITPNRQKMLLLNRESNFCCWAGTNEISLKEGDKIKFKDQVTISFYFSDIFSVEKQLTSEDEILTVLKVHKNKVLLYGEVWGTATWINKENLESHLS